MTPRTLFIIILRVLGILSLQDLFFSVPELLRVLLSFGKLYGLGDGFIMLFVSLLSVALNLAVSYILIFKAPQLANKLKLDSGINEPILQLNISLPSILRIAIIITAFLLLLYEIPNLVRLIYLGIQQREVTMLRADVDWSPAFFSGVRIIIGFLLIGERRRILDFLSRNSEDEKHQRY
jgi:hypothetical protein